MVKKTRIGNSAPLMLFVAFALATVMWTAVCFVILGMSSQSFATDASQKNDAQFKKINIFFKKIIFDKSGQIVEVLPAQLPEIQFNPTGDRLPEGTKLTISPNSFKTPKLFEADDDSKFFSEISVGGVKIDSRFSKSKRETKEVLNEELKDIISVW
jgi:hypothetical protein